MKIFLIILIILLTGTSNSLCGEVLQQVLLDKKIVNYLVDHPEARTKIHSNQELKLLLLETGPTFTNNDPSTSEYQKALAKLHKKITELTIAEMELDGEDNWNLPIK